ncbi:STAS/SEC14 domain-containing protein [Pleionea sediminis]|uniref:STAS/SEC14 domain-containing protein n=1 Tax=Pleionea sediminis TaxID=2569479 RepID=UPI001186192C|nr:STAS/SEC14 domain-containing protein [Pleionea sediminis]
MSGRLTLPDLNTVFSEVEKILEGNYFSYRIYDLSDCDIDISVMEQEDILTNVKNKLTRPNLKHRVALVSKDPLTQGFLKMLQYNSVAFQMSEIDIFSNQSDAINWLFS